MTGRTAVRQAISERVAPQIRRSSSRDKTFVPKAPTSEEALVV